MLRVLGYQNKVQLLLVTVLVHKQSVSQLLQSTQLAYFYRYFLATYFVSYVTEWKVLLLADVCVVVSVCVSECECVYVSVGV